MTGTGNLEMIGKPCCQASAQRLGRGDHVFPGPVAYEPKRQEEVDRVPPRVRKRKVCGSAAR